MTMTKANDPVEPIIDTDYTGDFPVSHVKHAGLTKREYFAAMAMQGYIAAGANGMPPSADIAQHAVRAADAMITELNR
jgi:hypothetical protein